MSMGTTIDIDRDRGCAERIPAGVLAAAAVSELLCARVREQLAEDRAPFDPLRGLRLDSTDVEHLLARRSSLQARDAHAGAATPFALPAAVAGSPLDVARSRLGLSEFETAVIALCLLPELDGRYGPLIGYLHDDVKRKQPSVELALSLFAPQGPACTICAPSSRGRRCWPGNSSSCRRTGRWCGARCNSTARSCGSCSARIASIPTWRMSRACPRPTRRRAAHPCLS